MNCTCRYNGGIVDDGAVEEYSRCCCFKIARVVGEVGLFEQNSPKFFKQQQCLADSWPCIMPGEEASAAKVHPLRYNQWYWYMQGLMTITLLTLLTIFGLSVAALVGGYRKYMFYRRDVFGGTVLRSWYALQLTHFCQIRMYASLCNGIHKGLNKYCFTGLGGTSSAPACSH